MNITGWFVRAADAAAGDEDRVERRRVATSPVAGRAGGRGWRAEDPAAPAHPRDPVGVDLHVVRVVGQAVVAPEVDRLGLDLRALQVA